MKAMLQFFGHDAIKVAAGTNRSPELLNDDGTKWEPTHIWKAKAVADRAPHKVRLRGYRDVLLKSASEEAASIIQKCKQ